MTTLTQLPGMSEKIGYAQTRRRRSDAPSGCDEHPTVSDERAACAADFAHFLNHWWFVNRDTGVARRFDEETLWSGQRNVVSKMQAYPWLLLLKAGKLGFTELECAFDGWTAIFRGPNTRIHIFSMDGTSAKNILQWVKFGIQHLPSWMGLPIETDQPGGDTTTSMKLRGGPDDVRTIVSYAANKNAAIDQVAHHSHVDELARMKWPEDTWSSVQSTVAPGGTVHVVSRGAGDGNYMTTLYNNATGGGSAFHPHFEPFTSRPRMPVNEVPPGADPNEVWYEEQLASGMPQHQLNWLAPRTPDDALKGSGEDSFLPEAVWDSCYDPGLPQLIPGDGTPIVLAADAGVTSDFFALVAVSRHPDHAQHPDAACSRTASDPAIRAVKVWRPPKGGEIDFREVEDWIRVVCLGGCYNWHPNKRGELSRGQMCAQHPTRKYQHALEVGRGTCEGDPIPCEMCTQGQRFQRFNVVTLAYDAYQMVDMAQSLHRDRVVWCYKFGQGDARLESDANLRTMAYQRRLAHPNDAVLNEHVRNANAKTAPGEDTKLRIVKRNKDGKIDSAVAASMAVSRCLYLNLKATGSTVEVA